MSETVMVLWAPPRSLSTAFVRVIAQRGDFTVLHEPLCDLAACGAYTITLQQRPDIRIENEKALFDYVNKLSRKGRVFVKDTCEYDYSKALDGSSYLQNSQHIFMLRDPQKVINSHHHMNPSLSCDQVGYRHLAKIYKLAKEQSTCSPTFINADELVEDTEKVVASFCKKVGLPHSPTSLQWAPGHLPIWERTRHWHEDAANSTGIVAIPRHYPTRVDNDSRLRSFYDANLPYFEYLVEQYQRQRDETL